MDGWNLFVCINRSKGQAKIGIITKFQWTAPVQGAAVFCKVLYRHYVSCTRGTFL